MMYQLKEFHMVKCCEKEFLLPLTGKQIQMLLNFKGSLRGYISQKFPSPWSRDFILYHEEHSGKS